ncbi:MAG: formate-dependent phosphoribosylglycinamide formyltransferase [Ignavibacteria bacterium]
MNILPKKIMLLGSGELGKETIISAQRFGCHVIAVDSYANAPGMQVADASEIISMLDGNALDAIVNKHAPDIIVPEIEAIRTERLYEFESRGIQVVPSAKAANFTMNRKAIRDLAAKDLQVKTARYGYATTREEAEQIANEMGYPCVIKPLMSSSGKGQSTIKSPADLPSCWEYAATGGRGDSTEVIIEEFISFDYEITLLTVTQKNGPTLFCPPIGHRQERGDYQESWQPCAMSERAFTKACDIARKVTEALTGAGLWGVEFFISGDEVYFSELSPRPHDTGMVTLAGTQTFSEFELHCRAILGLPIPEITLQRAGVSAVILHQHEDCIIPSFVGIDKALEFTNSDIRIFGKPKTRKYRRMGVALTWDTKDAEINELRAKAKKIADCITILPQQ